MRRPGKTHTHRRRCCCHKIEIIAGQSSVGSTHGATLCRVTSRWELWAAGGRRTTVAASSEVRRTQLATGITAPPPPPPLQYRDLPRHCTGYARMECKTVFQRARRAVCRFTEAERMGEYWRVVFEELPTEVERMLTGGWFSDNISTEMERMLKVGFRVANFERIPTGSESGLVSLVRIGTHSCATSPSA